MLKRIFLLLDPQRFEEGILATSFAIAQKSRAKVLVCLIDLGLYENKKATAEKNMQAADAFDPAIAHIWKQSQAYAVDHEMIFAQPILFQEALQHARSADLIMCSSAMLQKPVWRSIRKVLKSSGCPLLMLSPAMQESTQVLVALDDSAASMQALRQHVYLMSKQKYEYTLVHISQDPEKADRILETATEFLSGHKQSAMTIALPGTPEQIIPRLIQQQVFAHVLISANAHRKKHGYGLGKTGKNLVKKLPHSYFIVP